MTGKTDRRCPLRTSGARVEPRGEENVLLAAQGQATSLNTTALALWELCDGSTSVDEMVSAIDRFFDADAGVIRQDVTATLEELVARGFLSWRSGPPAVS